MKFLSSPAIPWTLLILLVSGVLWYVKHDGIKIGKAECIAEQTAAENKANDDTQKETVRLRKLDTAPDPALDAVLDHWMRP